MRASRVVLVAMLAAALSGPARAARADDAAEEALAKRIREALARATRALASPDAGPPNVGPPEEPGRRPPLRRGGRLREARPLVALALLRAGGPAEKARAKALVDEWWEEWFAQKGQGPRTYELALEIMALEGLSLDRLDDEHPRTVTRFEAKPIAAETKERLAVATRSLLAGRVASDQEGACAWSYGCAPLDGAATRERPGGRDRDRDKDDLERLARRVAGAWDNSNTQFAVLALHDAARAGVAVPADVVRGIALHFRRSVVRQERPPRPGATATGARGVVGWSYSDARGVPMPNMTYAGLSSLAVARDLGDDDAGIKETCAQALRTLGAMLDRTRELGVAYGEGGMGSAYALYSLEKALDLLDVKEVDGRAWFAPFATALLDAQAESGLWRNDPIDSALYVLFLVRATVTKARVKDSRTTGGGAQAGGDVEVFVPSLKKTVDAVALIEAYAAKPGERTRALALEALRAVEAEGHGRTIALLGALERLAAEGGDRGEAGRSWLRDVCGRTPKPDELARDRASYERLRASRDPRELRALLVASRLVPLRAWAASTLAALPAPDAAWDLVAAARSLDEATLATRAGSDAARAFADALTALTQAALPEAPPKGLVTRAQVAAIADAAAQKLDGRADAAVASALAAHPARESDPAAWGKAKRELAACGPRALERLVDVAAREPERATAAFAILRGATGELIPDDVEAWRSWIKSRS